MLTWGAFAAAAPEVAGIGRAMLHQVGVGLGFLGPIRADGGTRAHPVRPILTDDNEDAFYVTGVAPLTSDRPSAC